MLTYIECHRQGVRAAIADILAGLTPRMEAVSPLGADLAARLQSYTAPGKMIRGVLVRLGYELTAVTPVDETMQQVLDRAGAAMEFLQAGLLIHDDIMDRDCLRRGQMSLHADYSRAAREANVADPDHHGAAMGICAGDVAFFIGFNTLSSLPLPPGHPCATGRITALATSELCGVGVAQMQDVVNGVRLPGNDPDREAILQLYRYKTARYTFSLPLTVGAMLADAGGELLQALDRIGEALGVLFQLKDDELGLFGDAVSSGKEAGSDIREDKKTLLRYYLFKAADADLRAVLGRHFGAGTIDADALRGVREAAVRTGARDAARDCMRAFAATAAQRIDALNLHDAQHSRAAREALREILRYSLERTA